MNRTATVAPTGGAMADWLDDIPAENFHPIPDDIIAGLREVYTTDGIVIWLYSRNRTLAMERPVDVLRSGDVARVREAVSRLSSDG